MRQRVAALLCALVLAWPTASSVYAAPKKKGPKPIKAVDLSQAKVTVKVNKKKVKSKVFCYKKQAGEARKVKGGYSFSSYKALMKQDPSKRSLYAALNKAAKDICSSGGGTHVGPLPDFLSMEAYTGPFGEEQARTLFERFAWGASPGRIQEAVNDGLARTIQKLTNVVPEPLLDAAENNMRCTGLLPGDPRNGTPDYNCDILNPNDIDMGGLKAALLYRHWQSMNPFFDRAAFFIHDRFNATNTRALDWCQRWAVIPHLNMIRRAAQTGDYVRYMREFSDDYFGGMIWLHLLDSTKYSPNEDYGRELLQLGGVGPFNLDGTPVYGDMDVAQNSLALTGWVDSYKEDNNGNGICFPAYSRDLHADGPHRLFIGTAYEKQITDMNSVVDAIAAHPRLAEHIAENMFDEFINPFATPAAIRNLAGIIRTNNHNLLAAFKVVMGSKAVFAAQSRKSIPKQPLEILIGFLKASGLNLNGDIGNMRWLSSELGQTDLTPNTVFGWRNRDALAGESFVLARRNVLISLLNQDIEDLAAKGFNYWDQFLQGLPSDGSASAQFVARLQSRFNVRFNAKQVATLVQFLDYDQHTCNQWTRCAPGQTTYLERNQFDPAVDSSDEGRGTGSYKTRGAIALTVMMSEYMMK